MEQNFNPYAVPQTVATEALSQGIESESQGELVQCVAVELAAAQTWLLLLGIVLLLSSGIIIVIAISTVFATGMVLAGPFVVTLVAFTLIALLFFIGGIILLNIRRKNADFIGHNTLYSLENTFRLQIVFWRMAGITAVILMVINLLTTVASLITALS